MDLCQTAASLGLHKYVTGRPECGLFEHFHNVVLRHFKSLGVAATYIGAWGADYTGKFTKFGGRTHKRMERTCFADVALLSIVATPQGSDAPAYDGFASANLSYYETTGELVVCVVVNESFLELESNEYAGFLRSLIDLWRWDFGYGFSSGVDREPKKYILGIDNGKLSEEEFRTLNAWYTAPAEFRKRALRDVFPYNIVNIAQLDTVAADGVTLRQLAEQCPGCTVNRLPEYGLHLWLVPDAQIAGIRAKLAGSPALLS